MPKARDPNRDRAKQIYDEKQGNIDLVEIAGILGVPPGTVRGWKNKDNWNGTQQEKNTERSKKINKKKSKKSKRAADAEVVKKVRENNELNDKQKLFCLYYVKSFNATKAYMKAYGTDEYTGMSCGCRLLGKVKIKEEINKLKDIKINQSFFKQEDVFQKYMDIAFSDITDFTIFGTKEVTYLDKMGLQQVATVSYVDVKECDEVDGTLITEISQGKDGIKVKLADRMKALEWLSDHMGFATEEQKARIAALRAKSNDDNDDEETGVVLIPEVLPEGGDTK